MLDLTIRFFYSSKRKKKDYLEFTTVFPTVKVSLQCLCSTAVFGAALLAQRTLWKEMFQTDVRTLHMTWPEPLYSVYSGNLSSL